MSKRDKYHTNIREALEDDDWEITDDPYILRVTDEQNKAKSFFVDLGAEKLIAAKKDESKIAVEIKTFEGSSLINDYHRALGQYMDYLAGLELQEPDRELYLAVSN
ncbi:MAG: element excision factor XisH family protein [Chitinophagales bacterium]